MIRTTRTLGCFQIESPGQRELIGKFGPERFEDLVIDISLFRPGPVKSDMIVPFLKARHGWAEPEYLHPTLIPALARDRRRRRLPRAGAADRRRDHRSEPGPGRRGPPCTSAHLEVNSTSRPGGGPRRSLGAIPGRRRADLGGAARLRVVRVLQGARGGLRAAHLPVGLAQDPPPGGLPRRGAHPRPRHVPQAAHPRRRPLPGGRDPRPRRQRQQKHGMPSSASAPPAGSPPPPVGVFRHRADRRREPVPDGRGYGIRVSLTDVKGITEAEVTRIVAGQPYHRLADFAHRAQVSRPVWSGSCSPVGGLGLRHLDRHRAPAPTGPLAPAGSGVRERVTRRDLLLHVAELDRWVRSGGSGQGQGRPWVAAPGGAADPATMSPTGPGGASAGAPVTDTRALAAAHPRRELGVIVQQPGVPAGPGTIRSTSTSPRSRPPSPRRRPPCR
jgi:error-prone DNA polymerase